MPLTRFLQDVSFRPEEIAVLVAAYEAALRELDLTGSDPGAETSPRQSSDSGGRGSVIPSAFTSVPLSRSQTYHQQLCWITAPSASSKIEPTGFRCHGGAPVTGGAPGAVMRLRLSEQVLGKARVESLRSCCS